MAGGHGMIGVRDHRSRGLIDGGTEPPPEIPADIFEGALSRDPR